MSEEKPKGLALMRVPFPAHQIGKLPKPTRKQAEEVRNNYKCGIRCQICGQWHHPKVVHLDYIGHAALTDRLLDCDPKWSWEPVARKDDGTPAFDENGGLWIRLTVCGVTREGYGHPDGKRGGDAIKETIGDALRNAAMRFGAGLELWHKGDLHAEDNDDNGSQPPEQAKESGSSRQEQNPFDVAIKALRSCENTPDLANVWTGLPTNVKLNDKVLSAKEAKKAELRSLDEDEIPY